MGRDLLTNPYGRFYYLPKRLAQRGHKVYLLLLSHKRDRDVVNLCKDDIDWSSSSLFYKGPMGYLSIAKRLINDTHPDWIIGFSDTYYGILAQKLANRFRTQSAIDAYDNYEGYIPWLKPLHRSWRKAISKATLVIAAGPSLAECLGRSRPGKPTMVIPMAADPTGFEPMDRKTCRKKHGLSQTNKLIGYCGAITLSRGIDVLFEAFVELRKKHSEVELVLSGRRNQKVDLPAGARWLGYLPDNQIPALINCMDVFLVPNRLSSFGNYSHPVKLYEAMRCHVPVVANETLATRWIMRKHPELLVEPDNPRKLCEKIENALSLGRIDYGSQPDWETNGDLLEGALKRHSHSV